MFRNRKTDKKGRIFAQQNITQMLKNEIIKLRGKWMEPENELSPE